MGILNSYNIGAQGMDAHSHRLDIHAKNIANLDTPNYVRKIPVLISKDDISFSGLMTYMKDTVINSGTIPYVGGGVAFNGVVEDTTPGDLIYKPGHPDADQNGYIRASNVDPLVDMADAQMAARAYEASMAIVSITKQMANRAVDMGNS